MLAHARPERYRWSPAVRLLDSVAWLRTRITACLSEWMVTRVPPYVTLAECAGTSIRLRTAVRIELTTVAAGARMTRRKMAFRLPLWSFDTGGEACVLSESARSPWH